MTQDRPTPQPAAERPQGRAPGPESWHAASFLEKVTGVVPGIIYVFNQQTQSNEYSNRSLGEALGYSAEEVRDMGASMMPRLAHPEDLPRILDHFMAIRALADGDICKLEYRIRHKAGNWVWLLSQDTVFDRDDTGAVQRHIGVAIDVTSQKQAEEDALAQKRIADTANEQLSAFTYSLSHDLKAPSNTMRMILGELSAQHADSLDADGRMLIALGEDTLARMTRLIEDVLHFTRISRQEIDLTQVALGPLLDTLVQDLGGAVETSSAEIRVSPLPRVQGDETLLRMLFQNLLENALRYSAPDRPPLIRISHDPAASEGLVSISVQDNGIGIASRDHARIFGLFERLHLQSEISGSGLGLSICQRIVLILGGDIRVTSTPGEGSTFTVDLRPG